MAISCYSTGTTVRDVDPSSVGMMEGAFFVSRTELLDWVNTNFNLSLTKVEQAASGAVYLQIVDALYGGNTCVVPMAKVKWNCKYDYEYIQNYKLLQAVFTKQGIKKHIEVDRLIKGKYQDNLEFLQWLKAFYDRQAPAQLQQRAFHSKPYNALERRKLAGSVFPEWAQPSEGCSSAAAAGGADAAGAAAAAGGTPPPAPASAAAPNRHESSNRTVYMRGNRGWGQGSSNSSAVSAMHASAFNRCNSQCSPVTAGAGAAGAAHHSACTTSMRLHKQQQQHHSAMMGNTPNDNSTGVNCNSSSEAHSNSSSSSSHHHHSQSASEEGVGGQQQNVIVNQLQEEIKQLKELAAKLEAEGEQAWLEREFYFRKLRRLEIMCTTPGAVALSTKEVLAVLYATDDEAETQATAADDTFAASDQSSCMQVQNEQDHQEEPARSISNSSNHSNNSNTRNVSGSCTGAIVPSANAAAAGLPPPADAAVAVP